MTEPHEGLAGAPPEWRLLRLLAKDLPQFVAGHPLVVQSLEVAGEADRDAYRAVAALPASPADAALARLSLFANFSKPWILTAGVVALVGGASGRRAAVVSLAAVGATSVIVNQPMKLIGDRTRPEREALGVPQQRWVPMPTTRSFPSGHSASAAAFAVAMGREVPALRAPLALAAGTVGFSRVFTGVHYPGDVVVGMAAGAVIGRAASRLSRRRWPRARGVLGVARPGYRSEP